MSMTVLRWLAAAELVLMLLLAGLGAHMFPGASIGETLLLSTPLFIVASLFTMVSYAETSTVWRRVADGLLVALWGASELKWWMAECWFMEAVWRTGWWERLAMSLVEYGIGTLLIVLIVEYRLLPPLSRYVPGQLR